MKFQDILTENRLSELEEKKVNLLYKAFKKGVVSFEMGNFGTAEFSYTLSDDKFIDKQPYGNKIWVKPEKIYIKQENVKARNCNESVVIAAIREKFKKFKIELVTDKYFAYELEYFKV